MKLGMALILYVSVWPLSSLPPPEPYVGTVLHKLTAVPLAPSSSADATAPAVTKTGASLTGLTLIASTNSDALNAAPSPTRYLRVV